MREAKKAGLFYGLLRPQDTATGFELLTPEKNYRLVVPENFQSLLKKKLWENVFLRADLFGPQHLLVKRLIFSEDEPSLNQDWSEDIVDDSQDQDLEFYQHQIEKGFSI